MGDLSDTARGQIAEGLSTRYYDVWAQYREATPSTVQGLVDLFGGTRAVAEFLGVGIRQPELWLRRERGLGGVSRPIPEARKEQLQQEADTRLDDQADEKTLDRLKEVNHTVEIDFHGEVAAEGNADYQGYREWSGVLTGGAPLAAFWDHFGAHDFNAAAQSLNDAIMDTSAYDFPGAAIMVIDELDIGLDT